MNTKTTTALIWLGIIVLVASGITMIFFSFRPAPQTTPTLDVNIIYTNAAATVAAQNAAQPAPVLETQALPATAAVEATPLPPSPPAQSPTPAALPTVIPPTTGVDTKCDNAVYYQDVTIPDNTVVPAGKAFTKTWKIVNKGSCVWSKTYKLTFIIGDEMTGKPILLGVDVYPGGVGDVSVDMIAPTTPGVYTGKWKLTNDRGQTFGDLLTVIIKVDGSGTVSTPTIATAQPTEAASPTPTPP